MPDFRYEGIDRAGTGLAGTLAAADLPAALRALDQLGIVATRVNGATEPSRRWKRRGPSSADRLALLREFAVLVRAGVPLLECVEALIDAHRDGDFEAELTRLRTLLSGGARLERALQEAGLPLPRYVVQLIAAGESSGRLGEALASAVTQMANDFQIRQEIRNALTYPTVLILAGFAALSIMFVSVVPRFAHLLKNGRADLPWLSRVVIESGLFVKDHIAWLGMGCAALVGLIAVALFKPTGRESALALVARAPLVGRWLREVDVGRWAMTLAALLANRIQLLPALELSSGVPRLQAVRTALAGAVQELRLGKSLASVLETAHFLSRTQINLIRAGERSGQLATMIAALGEAQLDFCRNRMKRFLTLLEPIAILVLGILMGTLMISIMLAITSLNTMRL